MLELYQPRRSHLVRFQYDQRLTAQIILARNLWLQGYADRALALVEQMITEGQALEPTLSLGAVVCDAACFIALWVGDVALAARYTDMLKVHAAPAAQAWHAQINAFEGEILLRRGRAEEGVGLLAHAVQSLKAGPFCLNCTKFEGVLAEALLATGQINDAQETVEGAISRCRASGDAWYLAELMRIRAVVLAACDRLTEAVGVLADGLRLARAQGALAWELRLATTLLAVQNCTSAQDTLRGVLDQFQEGFGTSDYLRAVATLRC